MNKKNFRQTQAVKSQPQSFNESTPSSNSSEMIRIDGREQVLDMLRSADATFREVILKGLEKRDFKLAQELRREL